MSMVKLGGGGICLRKNVELGGGLRDTPLPSHPNPNEPSHHKFPPHLLPSAQHPAKSSVFHAGMNGTYGASSPPAPHEVRLGGPLPRATLSKTCLGLVHTTGQRCVYGLSEFWIRATQNTITDRVEVAAEGRCHSLSSRADWGWEYPT